jgi:prepilin-type N-terminal cleavage/methylation domain-containing protein
LNCNAKRRFQSGFTLAEVAMVLIIVGALITGILVASQTVLYKVRLASLISSVKDLASAAQGFKTRYGYYPGDLPNAGTYITTNGGISAGCIYVIGGLVGDGLVNSAIESDCALEHMVKAGSLSKVDYDGARYFVGSTIGAGNVAVSLWFNALTNENVVRVTNLPCDAALDLDRRFDSGTVANTPFNQGWLTAQDAGAAQIANCISAGNPGGPLNDPVPTVLIKY